MSTLVTNNAIPLSNRKQKLFNRLALILAIVGILCIAIDNIYAVFGHAVRSPYMSFMFLYSLCGAVVYFLLGKFFPKTNGGKLKRLGINLFNSGLATLTVGSFLKGILEIAGSSSDYVIFFFTIGWVLTIIGFVSLILSGVTTK